MAARMLAAPGQSPSFSYGRVMGLTAGHPASDAIQTAQQGGNLNRGLYLPKINSHTSQQNQAKARMSELQQKMAKLQYLSHSEDQQVDYQQTYHNFQ
jgi:hypothetical protein